MSRIPFQKIVYTPIDNECHSDGRPYKVGYDYLFFGILVYRIYGKRVTENTFK